MCNAGESGAIGEREFIPTRQTLLSRLKNLDDEDSWKQFFDRYWKLIYSAAVKAGLSDAEAQDVVQDTVISVSRNIGSYDRSRGSFRNWLLTMTRWRIVDQLRKRPPPRASSHASDGDTARTATVERIADPSTANLEAFWDEEWEKNIIAIAVERVKLKIDPKHFQVFDLSVLKGWTISQIAETLRLSRPRIYVIKHRASKLVQKEIQQLGKELG